MFKFLWEMKGPNCSFVQFQVVLLLVVIFEVLAGIYFTFFSGFNAFKCCKFEQGT